MTLTSPDVSSLNVWQIQRLLDRPTRCASRDARSEHQDALARLYQAFPDHREAVLERLMPLANALARRYKRGEEPLEDLEQVAAMGLMKALNGFDPDCGRPFSAYAVPTITGELRRHFRDHGWAIHVPRSLQEASARVTDLDRAFATEHNRSPTVGEVAETLQMSEELVVDARLARRAMRAGSLDLPTDDGDDGSTYRRQAWAATEDEGYELVEARATLATLIEGLDERERRILTLRFFGEQTQREIGEQVGLSQMQISRLLKRTLSRLRDDVRATAAG